MFDWKDSYKIGVAEIDAQHRQLYGLADELHTAMNNGRGKAVIEQVLANLVGYTKTHFQAEEQMMLRHHYPDFQAHKAQHDQLTAQVMKLQQDYTAGRSAMTVDVMIFLSDWLRKHIGGTDRKYVPFVNGKAVA